MYIAGLRVRYQTTTFRTQKIKKSVWIYERRVRCETHCNIKIVRYGLSHFFSGSKSRGKYTEYATCCNTTKHVFCYDVIFMLLWYCIKGLHLHAQHNPLVVVMDTICVLCKAQNKLQCISFIKFICFYANYYVDILINIHTLLFMVTFINWWDMSQWWSYQLMGHVPMVTPNIQLS